MDLAASKQSKIVTQCIRIQYIEIYSNDLPGLWCNFKSGNKLEKVAKFLVYNETDWKKVKTETGWQKTEYMQSEQARGFGHLPFILFSLFCSLIVWRRAGLIGFSHCRPTLAKSFAPRPVTTVTLQWQS